MKRVTGSVFSLVLFLVGVSALALPVVQEASDTEDDAKITVRLNNQFITDDAESWCEVQIEVSEVNEVFTAGDRVFLWIYESDLAFNDLVWETDFTVQGGGSINRTFDCSSNFGYDSLGSGELELYAGARVEKADCGTFCFWDRPETSTLDLTAVTDDGREEDDNISSASVVGLGTTSGIVNRDQDWMRFETNDRSRVTVEVNHNPSVGRLELSLFDDASNQIASGVDSDDKTDLATEVGAGVHYIRVTPRLSNNFNFYDVRLLVDTLAADCVAGSIEDTACGNCGTQSRTCDSNGRWGPFGTCGSEGECAPGSEVTDSCGMCGQRQTVCNDACTFVAGMCEREGVCTPDSIETESCTDGGERSRQCDNLCAWGDFGECGGGECEPGETRPCYSGPAVTRGVGLCSDGVEACVQRFWSGDCRDETLPTTEACDDRLDNDCDGTEDSADMDCVEPGGALGEACEQDGDCEDPYDCVGAPQDAVFVGGYCSIAECDASECGSDGFCGQIFGESYCFLSCGTDADCRSGYRCQELEDQQGCVPSCTSDRQCRDDELSVCDLNSGRCVEESNGTTGGGTSNGTTGGGTTGGGTSNGTTGDEATGGVATAKNEACGCATPSRSAPPMSALTLLAVLGLVLLLGRSQR